MSVDDLLAGATVVHGDQPGGYRSDAIGNAERFADQHRQHARFVPAWRRWIIWNGCQWQHDLEDVRALALAKGTARRIPDEIRLADGDLARVVAQTAGWNGNMPAELAEQRDRTERDLKALVKHATRSSSAPALRDMLKLAQSEPGMSIGVGMLDAEPRILNTPTGIVDLVTGLLGPHDPARLCTRVTATAYDPVATSPRWLEFLELILLSADLINYVQRLIGLAITGNPGERLLPILAGPGGTGKSTFANVLQAVLGDYAATGNGEALLLTRRGGGPDEDLADLAGRRLVVLPELPGGRLNTSRIKRLTGGDKIRTHKKFEHTFEFAPTHTFFVFTNTKPRVDEHSDAVWDRIRVVPFEKRIPADVRMAKAEAEQYLLAEAPGILAWAVQGAVQNCRDGLGEEPAVVRLRTAAYHSEEDVIGQWLDACCDRLDGAWTASRKLHESYVAWCEANGEEKPIGMRTLVKELGSRGFESAPSSDRTLRGVKALRVRTFGTSDV
jgi:P4 family phage/plasmid primase-like protien